MRKLIIALACASVPATLSAEQWQILGTRPLGMGGAFVAVAQGPIAQYWNPAGLAMASSKTVSGMEIPLTAGVELTGGIMKNATDIGSMSSQLSSIKAAQSATSGNKAITPDEAASFVKTMSLLNDMTGKGKGVLVQADGGANFKLSKVAVSINNFTSVGVTPFIDVNNLNLSRTGNSIAFNSNSGNGTLTNTGGNNYIQASADLSAALSKLDTTTTDMAYTLLCGTTHCGDASITNSMTLAHALAYYAQQNSISAAQISQAATVISQYAASAGPVVAGALNGQSYTQNGSNLTVEAASFTEIAFGYGKFMKFLDGLSIGGNVKMVNGRMATSTFQFMQNSQTSDAFKNMLTDSKSSWAPALDVAALWDVNTKYPKFPLNPKVGLVIRNINSPKFDMPDLIGGKYKLDRQARMGLALNPAKFWTLAMDMDLTKNKTEVNGFDSRELALGTEINIVNRKAFNIPLRAGIMKNMAESGSKAAYTLGTGINLLYMHLDVAGAVSSDRTTLDNKTSNVPTRVSVSASFGLLF